MILRETLPIPPQENIPIITEELIPGTIKCTGMAQHHPGDSDTSQESTWRNPHTTIDAAYRHLVRAIQEVTEIAVRYVSSKEKWETSAIIIEGHKSSLHGISASSTTPGHPKDQEAYRGELSGLLHTVMIVESQCDKYNIKEGEITAACNGINSIIIYMDRYTYFFSRSNNFDILSAIDSKIQSSPIKWKWRHVKGHQDKKFGLLEIWDSLNVE